MVSDATLTGADIQNGSVTGDDVQDGTILRDDVGESLIRLGTQQATTSGVFKEFTNIPAWARRITVSLWFVSSGFIELAGVLNYLRIVTANGTDAFDAGAVNISWE